MKTKLKIGEVEITPYSPDYCLEEGDEFGEGREGDMCRFADGKPMYCSLFKKFLKQGKSGDKWFYLRCDECKKMEGDSQ